MTVSNIMRKVVEAMSTSQDSKTLKQEVKLIMRGVGKELRRILSGTAREVFRPKRKRR